MKGLIGAVLAVVLCSLTVYGSAMIDGYQVESKAAVVIEDQSGRVVFWQDGDKRLPMASTTKIMSALIALEQQNLDKQFVVDSTAIKVEGSSMGLREGDLVTMRALASGMLLSSGNDAANAAAVKVAGSVAGFVDMMNQRAERMGLKNTSFETPSGLDGENHYSSAYDMALLARNALANPDFAQICSSKRLTVEYGNPPYRRSMSNHNRLLSYYEGTIGVKTGFTKKSGRCLVSAATKDDITLICVTLNCPDDWNVHKELYELSFPLFERIKPDLPADISSIPVGGGTSPEVKLECSGFEGVTVAKGEKDIVQTNIYLDKFALAPVKKGQILGRINISVAGIPIDSQYLTAAEEVPARPLAEKKSLWERIIEKFNK